MAIEPGAPKAKGYTRRNFLWGMAALAGVGLFLRGAFSPRSNHRRARAEDPFPGEDSIYHPREDPRIRASKLNKPK